MQPDTSRKYTHEDMLLRVIRVAQILVKGRENSVETYTHNTRNNTPDDHTTQARKTQN